MRRSYLGIISKRGLESLLPECERTRSMIASVVCRQRARAACCWVVMQDHDATRIMQFVGQGYTSAALTALQVQATDGGLLAPAELAGPPNCPTDLP